MKTRILSLITLILALGTIYLYLSKRELQRQLQKPITQVRVDTVYKYKPFALDKPLSFESVPEVVSVYRKPITIFATDTTYRDSLVQFSLNSKKLNLSFLRKDSTVVTKEFKIDTDRYRYLYNNGMLTQNKRVKVRLEPFIKTSIRPINQLYDVEMGLGIHNKHFSYSIGFNMGYYPKLTPTIQKDVQLSIQYNF